MSGSGQGDFDFYAISGVTAGQIITADINTADIDTQDEDMFFDSFLAIWDSAGNLLATNDDAPLNGNDSFIFDSFIVFAAPQDGTYYLSVGAADAPVPDDPFDS